MKREPFENMPDVMDAKQIAQALHLSKAGAYNLLNEPDFPTLQIGGRKLVMKQDLIAWLKSKTNTKKRKRGVMKIQLNFTGWMQAVCLQSRQPFSIPFFKRHDSGRA